MVDTEALDRIGYDIKSTHYNELQSICESILRRSMKVA